MRYFTTDEQIVTIAQLEAALKQMDPVYSIEGFEEDGRECGILMYQQDVYGRIEINRRGSDLLASEVLEFKDFLRDVEGSTDFIRWVLENAQAVIAVQVLMQRRDTESTLIRLDPLWHWLFENRKGLLQADGEGFYEGTTLILEMNR